MASGADYERIVADVIEAMQIFRATDAGATTQVFRRKRYSGAQDPHGYEIDVSLEVRLPPGLRLLVIVECKAHSRPVERSVVQQLIQVRDDIAANKAILVSTHGFNEGAIRLAQKSGISLWQYANYVLTPVVEYAEGRAHDSLHDRYWPLVRMAIEFFSPRGVCLDAEALEHEQSSVSRRATLIPVHFIYNLSADQLEIVPPPLHGEWIEQTLTDPPLPKRQLLEWVIEALAAAPGGELVQAHFRDHIQLPDGPVEFERLLDSVQRFKNTDISTTLLDGWRRRQERAKRQRDN
jgi:hypothetical protein